MPILHDTDGHEISITQLKNKWVIINYWASWCANCIEEVQEFNHFYANNRDKNIVLYGVNYNHLPIHDLKEDIQKVGIHYPVLIEDPSQIWHFDLMDVIPFTFIVNPAGKVAKTIIGTTSEQDLLGIIRSLQYGISSSSAT
jgi:thiol-disulfide isomerase/thioredoxin